jgi:hypothetical protein
MQTVKFATFPFTHKGYKFVSRIAETCDQLPLIMIMGEDFIKMNKEAIDDLMPDLEDMSWASIEKQMTNLNMGATQMFLDLVGVE